MSDINFDSPAWRAKRALNETKQRLGRGEATIDELTAAADAYINEIKAWAKAKGVKVRLPRRADLTR